MTPWCAGYRSDQLEIAACLSMREPVVDDAAHVAQAGEPVLRQALVAEAAVEALDVGVPHRAFPAG